MKTSLKKLLTHHHHKHDLKDRKVQPLAQLDELAKTSEDMEDMRDCYDSLLSAAAAAANSAYEFSESLREMGVCLLQKIALNDDEETGKVMLMLGKVQFELQKIVDSYRSHIFQTITVPSESLTNELHTVEEMKHQCDEKRELYEYMRTRYMEKGRSKSGKGESFSSEQVQAAKEEFDEEATLFVFRIKSLKQGQSRSLLTQASRHHAAQLSFFRKALKALEAVDPHVKLVTEQQHIDYQFSGLEDDESEDSEDDIDNDEDDVSYTSSVEDDGELSFDYRRNDRKHNFVSATRDTMELDLDITFPEASREVNAKEHMKASYQDTFVREQKVISQSAPLFPQQKMDPAERMRQLRPSSTRKFHSYVLPKPGDTRSSFSIENAIPQTKSRTQHARNLYHSYPLEPTKYEKFVGTENLSGPIILNTNKSILKESNNNRMPPPLTQQLNPDAISSIKRPKLQSLSGPLTSRPLSTKPSSSNDNPLTSKEPPKFSSGPIMRSPVQQSWTSSKVSPSASPPFTSSPQISELHELPRPPKHLNYGSGRPSGFVGFSAPLVSRSQETSITSRTSVPKTASPLPIPPLVSYSHMPSGSSRSVPRSPPSKPLQVSHSSEKLKDIASPPLTPMDLANAHPT